MLSKKSIRIHKTIKAEQIMYGYKQPELAENVVYAVFVAVCAWLLGAE